MIKDKMTWSRRQELGESTRSSSAKHLHVISNGASLHVMI